MAPLAFSEIEPFPCAVLAHRFPRVPNLGDFTRIDAARLAAADILVGGTPCQAFSVLGLRGGLADARGNLTLSFVRLANAIDDIRRDRGAAPLIIAWENVPGILTMPDNAFGCLIAGLAGAGAALIPPGRKRRWTNAGLALGPRRAVAWRRLDAQYFGLAQRRKRMFVVASARKDIPAKILFERQGVRGNPAPREKPRKAIAGTLNARSAGGGGLGPDFELDGGLIAFGGNNCSGPIDVATALSARGGAGRIDFETETFVTAFDCKASGQMGFGAGDIAPTMRAMGSAKSHANAGGQLAVAISLRGREGGGMAEISGDLCPALRASQGGGDKPHVLTASTVRRLMPVECERLQGFPDHYTAIPWRGKPADQCPDGPRYKALGNSMPVPVMRFLGERILQYGGAE